MTPRNAKTVKTEDLAIETEDLWRIYPTDAEPEVALRGINLRIARGHFIALKGRSGSGKTTLLNCVGGLDQPTRGNVRVFGRALGEFDDLQLTQWRCRQIGFVFQSFGLMPTLSAYENIELILRLVGLDPSQRDERTRACLELVGLMPWQHHRPFELSGGQQQRVAIARALANRAPLILADEPTGELDSTTAREILNLFGRIVREENVTVLIVSHDPLVHDYADYVLQLEDGQIVSSQPSASKTAPDRPRPSAKGR